MTAAQRAAAFQLASALRDALPRAAFDEERFLATLLEDSPTAAPHDAGAPGVSP